MPRSETIAWYPADNAELQYCDVVSVGFLGRSCLADNRAFWIRWAGDRPAPAFLAFQDGMLNPGALDVVRKPSGRLSRLMRT